MTEQVSQPASPRARAIHQLRNWVESGQLGRGEALPSERALAAKLEVGRATIRRALRVLQADGLILDRGGHIRTVAPERKPGEGLLRGTIAVIMTDRGRNAGMAAIEAGLLAGAAMFAIAGEQLVTEKLDQLILDRPMGVLATGASQQVIEALDRACVPVVTDTDLPGADRVVLDHEDASFELTRWLIAQGRRRILTLWQGLTRDYVVRDRLAGHARACREANVQPLEPVQMPALQVEHGAQRFEAEARLAVGYLTPFLSGANAADAIMAETDKDVAAIAEACRILGKKAGTDVLLAGYGGGEQWGETAVTVDLVPAEIGRELVRLLMDRAGRKLPDQHQRRIVKGRLMVLHNQQPRQSATPAPVTTPVAHEGGKPEPLFGWKMEGGRWTLGGRKEHRE